MATRPSVIAFDVIETLFSLEPVRQRLVAAGQPDGMLDLWFARMLWDAFAVVGSGGYVPFGEIAASTLRSITGHSLTEDDVRRILAGFGELEPHPDVEPAVALVQEAGVRMITLTNDSAQNTAKLLRRAGLCEYFDLTLSVSDVQRWKPAPEIYWHAANRTQEPPDRVALVGSHAWDIHGAHHAGLTTGWVARLEPDFPDIFAKPDVVGGDLVAVVSALLASPRNAPSKD